MTHLGTTEKLSFGDTALYEYTVAATALLAVMPSGHESVGTLYEPSSLIVTVPRSISSDFTRDSESLRHVKPLSPVALVDLASPHRIATRRERKLCHPTPLSCYRSGNVAEAHAQSVRVRDRSIRGLVVVDDNTFEMIVQVAYR